MSVYLSAGGARHRLTAASKQQLIFIILPEANLGQRGGDAVLPVWLFVQFYFCFINATNASSGVGKLRPEPSQVFFQKTNLEGC